MIGLLVMGENHFVTHGPLPDRETALALAREWSCIQIGQVMPARLEQWSISTRAFREDLAWAVLVPGTGETSAAVTLLLEELAARGIGIRDSRVSDWAGAHGS